MRKAKLIKKNAIKQSTQVRKADRAHVLQPDKSRTALEITTEWIKRRREESATARKAFAALFVNSDPQSA